MVRVLKMRQECPPLALPKTDLSGIMTSISIGCIHLFIVCMFNSISHPLIYCFSTLISIEQMIVSRG